MKETTGYSLGWGTPTRLLRVLVAGASLLAVVAATPVFGQTDWVAYNDCVYDPGQAGVATDPNGQSVHYIAPDVTTFGIGTNYSGPTSGELLEYQPAVSPTGTGVTATLTQSGGVVWQPDTNTTWYGGYDAALFTDARNTFGGIADMTGVVYYGSSGWNVDLTFTGLDADAEYTFATSATRCKGTYTRLTIYTLTGADTFTNASTSGVDVLAPNSVRFNTGDNYNEGYVARWTGITAADGSFSVHAEADSGSDDGYKAYAFDVFMLEQFSTGAPECTVHADCDDGDLCTGDETCDAGSCVGGTPVVCDPGEVCDPDTGECVAQVTDWIAYNDMNPVAAGDANPPNVTTHDYTAVNAVLKNYIGGADLTVTITGTTVGGYDPAHPTNGGQANAGTDAGDTFGPSGSVIVDLGNAIELDAADWDNIITFDNLDPAKEYAITLTANRDNPDYANQRYSKVTIEGADAATNASTSGVVVNSNESVSFSIGYNTVNGYVAKWVGVSSGADGSFSIKSEWDNSLAGTKGYAMGAFKLEQLGAATGCTINADCDDGNVCTDDFCDTDTGECSNPPNTDPCDDAIDCTVGDECSGGACVAGTPDDLLCDDGDECNGTETCDAIGGCQPGTPLVCSPGETCNPDTGICEPSVVVCEGFEGWPTLGDPIGDDSDWYDGGGGPVVNSGVGVAGTTGLEPAGAIFTWTAHGFKWNDPGFVAFNVQMDFETDGSGVLDDDRVGWMIDNASTDSDLIFGVQVDPSGDGEGDPAGSTRLEGYWDAIINVDENHRPFIDSLSGNLSPNTFYRLHAEITKLTATSASVYASVTELDGAGNPVGAPVLEGTIADTSALGGDSPDPGYFTPTMVWPAYKNYTSAGANADNTCFEIVTEDRFAFVVVADSRTQFQQTAFEADLVQIQDWLNNPTTDMPAPSFLVFTGDFDHTWQTEDSIDIVLGADFLWYPVIGNHEIDVINDFYEVRDTMVPSLPGIVDYGPPGSVNTSYSWDYGNAHFVSVNCYWDGTTNAGADHLTDGDIPANLLSWIDADLTSNDQTHNFAFVHEPAYPEVRHIGGSLDQYQTNRDAFVSMLDGNNVEMLFVGHDHYYHHDVSTEHPLLGNMHQVSSGQIQGPLSGGDGSTIVYVLVDGAATTYKVYRSTTGFPFALHEEWTIESAPPTDPPDAPTDLSATAISDSTIGLAWTDNSDNEAAFEIERSTDGAGGPFSLLTTEPADTTAHSDAGLDPVTEYCYRVRATNVVGESGYSNVDCATTLTTPPVDVVCEDFEIGFAGATVGTHSDWYDAGGGPIASAGIGVVGSVGLASANNIFTWVAHPFDWNHPDFVGVNFQMDFQTDGSGNFDDDRLGFMITAGDVSSTNIFGAQLDHIDGEIVTYWRDGSGTRIQTLIVSLAGTKADTWYRFRNEITKLTATSASLDVSLVELDASGNPTGTPFAGTVADTSVWPGGAPDTKYFTAATIWPAYKNYNAVAGAADNACAEFVSAGCTHDDDCDDDDDACTLNDRCVDEICVYDFTTDPCDDADVCTEDDACADGVCVGGPAVDCDDGDLCNGVETCDPELGCQPGTPLDCDDANVCTDDSCDPAIGCVYDFNTAPCEDGDPCTINDSCVDGICVSGPPPECDEGLLLAEYFTVYSPGDDPADWLDTGAGNSMLEDDNFQVFEVSANPALGTTSTLTNIHSHYVTAESANWTDYTFTGRMMIDAANGGTGVTFLSAFPNADAYYRLRRHQYFPELHMSVHGTSFPTGTTNTGVVPLPDTWYLFRIEVEDTGTATQLRARVWPEGTLEPTTTWQADCYDDSPTRRTAGTVGVWSMGPGGKYWDDLVISGSRCGVGAGDCDDGDVCNGEETCQDGVCVPGTPPDCDDGNVCTADSCDPAQGCVHDDISGMCEDEVACTVDACDPIIGCTSTPDDTLCDDNDLCTEETCDALEGCLYEDVSDQCDDNNVCTADSCDPAQGCVYSDISATCDDEIACTHDDCDPVLGCMNAPDDLLCDDEDACTDDTCNPVTGCVHTANPECESDVQIVPVASLVDPSTTSETSSPAPPESATTVTANAPYWVEIWASDTGTVNTGLTGVYVDVSFCDDTAATDISHGTVFTTLATGTIGPDSVDEFGGAALPSGGGSEPEWVRIGWIEMNAGASMQDCAIALSPSATGVGAYDRGLVPWDQVELGSVLLSTGGEPGGVTYDLDGDGFIGVGDLSLWAASWDQLVPPAQAAHDFDCDGYVGPGDLSWFATGWLKFVGDPTILYPPPCPGGVAAFATGSTDVEFTLVARPEPSLWETSPTAPTSRDLRSLRLGETFYVEVWATDVGLLNTGLTSAYVDLTFPNDAISAMMVSHGGTFTHFTNGLVDIGIIDELGGSALLGWQGTEPQWVRVAVVKMHADAAARLTTLSLIPSRTGVAAYGRGVVDWDDITLDAITIHGPIRRDHSRLGPEGRGAKP